MKVNILEQYPANTFLCFLNSDDDINRAFSHALEHYESPFPFRSEIANRLFEHYQIQRTGTLTIKTKDGEMHLNDLDTSMKLAILIGEDFCDNFCRNCIYTFVSLDYLNSKAMRWLCENYDLTLYCLYDDIENCPRWQTFDGHIRFVYNGEVVSDIINFRIHRCTFTRGKEAKSFEKHFGNRQMLKHDHIRQYADLKEEVDTDEYATPYTFGDLLDELDDAEKGKRSPNNLHYTYAAILSGGVFCYDRIKEDTRIYLLNRCDDYVYGRVKTSRFSTNGDILRLLENIYECGNSESLTAIIADGDGASEDFANDYIPHIQYGVEIDFVTRTVYILDPTSAAVRYHNALQDSLITDEQHPYIYYSFCKDI